MRLGLLTTIACLIACAGVARAQLLHDVIHSEVELHGPEITVAGKISVVTMVSQELTSELTGVAVQGFTDTDSLSGDVRFLTGEVWGVWYPLYIVRSATDSAFLGAYRHDQPRMARKFQLRFQVGSSDELEKVSAGTFDQRLDEEEDQSGEISPQSLQQDDFVITPPHVRRRSEWKAQPFRGTPIPLNRPSYDYMTLHHTAGFAAKTLSQGLEQVRRIQDFHQNGRGWSDIGYQFLMDQEGRLYQGRPFLNEAVPFTEGPRLVQGAHVGGANRGNIGVSLMGCYHPPEGARCRDQMTAAAVDSLIVSFSFLSERYEVSADNMRGHRDFGSTSCPGDNNYPRLPEFQLDVADLLLRGNRQLGQATMSARLHQSGVVDLKWTFLLDNGIDEFIVQRRKEGDHVIELMRGEGAVDGRIIDSPSVGHHVYELVVKDKKGTQQTLAVADVSIEPSETNVLAQSFPNPATTTTTIRYFLKDESGIVSVNLFDLTGRLVLKGEHLYRESGEWYFTTLDTSVLPGGVYLYRISVTGFSSIVFEKTQPLIVL